MAELATLARPYAEAVYQLAESDDAREVWCYTLEKLVSLIEMSDFEQLTLNPRVSTSQIVDFLLSFIAEDKKSVSVEQLKRFLDELVSNRRTLALPEILKQYLQMCDAAQGFAEAIVYTAYPMSDDQLNGLLPKLEKRFNTKLKTEVKVDTSLIGGICVVVGDDTLDLSVKARLEQMKQALNA